MHRHPDLIGRQQAFAVALARKCEHVEIDVPAQPPSPSPLPTKWNSDPANLAGSARTPSFQSATGLPSRMMEGSRVARIS
jgi:hypothetical protein